MSSASDASAAVSAEEMKEAVRVFGLVRSNKFVEDEKNPTVLQDTLKFFQDGARAGNVDCKYYLAMSTAMGKFGLEKDANRTVAMLTELVQENHAFAIVSLACAFREGYWVPGSKRDPDAAYRLFERLASCPNLSPGVSPWNELHLLLPHTARGLEMSKEERNAACVKLLEDGCEKNDAACLHNLSMVYINGTHGKSISEPKAVELEQRAAQSDCPHGKHAKWNLGTWYREGRYGLEKSWATTEGLWLRAENHDSLHSLGLSYEPGYPPREDQAVPPVLSDQKAFDFYTRAVDKFGNTSSMCNLVNFYDGHKPFPEFLPDPFEAIYLMTTACKKGVWAMRPQLQRYLEKLNLEAQMQKELLRAAAEPSDVKAAAAAPEVSNPLYVTLRGWKAEASVAELMAKGFIEPNLELARYYRDQAAEHGAPSENMAQADRFIEAMEQAPAQPQETEPQVSADHGNAAKET